MDVNQLFILFLAIVPRVVVDILRNLQNRFQIDIITTVVHVCLCRGWMRSTFYYSDSVLLTILH